MLGSLFYNNSIRKSVSVFGNLFNDIRIRRFDKSNNTLQTIPVPISYGRRAKFFAMLERDPITTIPQIQLPAMAFIMTGINFATDRKTSPLNKNRNTIDPQFMATQFAEIPYNLDFELSIMAKSYDDAAQIVEQIIPYFQPSFIPSAKLIPEMGNSYDLKVTLNGLDLNDDFEGTADEQGILTWVLTFTMNSYFFGEVSKQGVIKRTMVDLIPVPGQGQITAEEVGTHGRASRITIVPGLTADGQPTGNPQLTIPYSEIDADDPYGFIQTLDTFDDGKKWNPKKGKDE